MDKLFAEAKELYAQKRWADFNQFFYDNLKESLDSYSEKEVSELCFWQGMSYLRRNLFSEARSSFDLLAQKYPHNHLADEGKIQILFAECKYQDVIRSSFLFQEKFPNFWQSYEWRANAFLSLKKYKEAIREFRIIKLLFPDIIQGYQGLYHANKQRRLADGSYLPNRDLLEELRDLALHKNSSHHHRLEFIQSLLAVRMVRVAEEYLEILKEHPESYFLMKAKVAFRCSDYQTAFDCYSRLLMLSDYDDKRKSLGGAYSTFKRLKKGKDYIALADDLKNHNDSMATTLLWADSHTINQSWRLGWQIKAERLAEEIRLGRMESLVLRHYLTSLLSLNQFHQAELVLTFAIRQYSEDWAINRLYCMVAHHKKDWQVAKERFDKFFEKFNYSAALFYEYANILYNIGEADKIYEYYHKFTDIKFAHIDKNNSLNCLQIDLLLSREPSDCHNDNKGKHSLEKIQSLTPALKEVIHDNTNEVLIICFDRLRDDLEGQDAYDSFETDDIFNECVRLNEKFNDFDGFAKNNKEFNYLLVRDFSCSYSLLNFDVFLEILKQKINNINPKYIVCMGTSAGAFASILYGQCLGVNVVFAMMARLHAFMTPNLKPIHRKVQEHFDLTDPNLISMPYLQKQTGGFMPKVYVAICENEASEMMGTYALDKSDPNLHISYFEGDVHALLEYVGVRNIYAELSRVIKAELENNFELPIQRDIFSQIDGYKDSSFDRLKNE